MTQMDGEQHARVRRLLMCCAYQKLCNRAPMQIGSVVGKLPKVCRITQFWRLGLRLAAMSLELFGLEKESLYLTLRSLA